MQLCDRDGIPLLFLHNVTGFMVGREYERRGITKDGAKMLMVQANVTVPKLTRAVPRLAGRRATTRWRAARGTRASLYAWPNSRSSIMGPEVAADTLTQVRVSALRRQGKDPGTDEIGRIRADVMAHFEADVPLVLPDVRPARRRADRPARHAQHARHVAVRRAERPDRPHARRRAAHLEETPWMTTSSTRSATAWPG